MPSSLHVPLPDPALQDWTVNRRWLPVQCRVRGDTATVAAGSPPQPLLTVKLTYYLEAGCVGVYCGTRTNGSFRKMQVELLD